LPEIIKSLWNERDVAKKAHNAPLSQAVKIIMNSFYGVLGSTGCRFFDPRLASSITRRGHEIIQRSRDWIEEYGYQVIYGDTDSLFVLLGAKHDEVASSEIGKELARGLNQWWANHLHDQYSLPSYLEIEFETHYLRFLMPTIRGSETGSKKRYAGSIRKGEQIEITFKGLETVRTDWTPLAREMQRELYQRIFFDEPWQDYLRETVADLYAGKLDHKLVYKKRLRRKLADYIKNVPPHVQAARKLSYADKQIEYLITQQGPEPLELFEKSSGLLPDYEHYINRQLAPAADGILHFLGTRFEDVVGQQGSLF
ncbi:MAG: DNA polymerase II, partial [Desulfobacterales bacterium]|nr:DNA polymerase II [Desulfobacterales bacterium]